MGDRLLFDALLGDPVHRRRRYGLAVAGITLSVLAVGSVGDLDSWFASRVWFTALLGSSIGVIAGWDDQGLVSASLGAMVYVVVLSVGFTPFTSTVVWSHPLLVRRAVVVVCLATAVVGVPGYLVGVCGRIVAARRDWDVAPAR